MKNKEIKTNIDFKYESSIKWKILKIVIKKQKLINKESIKEDKNTYSNNLKYREYRV